MAGKHNIKSVDLNTNGLCFLCLNVVSTSENELKSRSSLTTLFNHVGISLETLFEAETSKSEDYCRGRSTTVEASLCEECSKINGNIIEFSRVIEIAMMKINYNVDSIRRKIEAGRRPERIIIYQRRMKSELWGTGLALMEKVDKVRKRLLSKCAEVISRSIFQPCVKIRKLPEEHFRSKATRMQFLKEKTRELYPSSGINIKEEVSELTQLSDPLHIPFEEQSASNELVSSGTVIKQETSKRHKCGICDKTFDDEFMLYMHKSLSCSKLRSIRSSQTADHSSLQSQPDPLQVDSVPIVVSVKSLGVASNTKSIVNSEGVAPINNFGCPIIPQNLTLLQLNRSADNAAASQSQSSKSRKNPKKIKRPVVIQKCRQCHKIFKSKTASIFIAHQNLCTAPPRAYPANKVACPICGKMLKSPHSLKKHHQYVHLNEREFECNQCGKAFCSQGDLKRHQQSIHDRVRFNCNSFGCERSFTSQYALQIHQKTVHIKQLLSEAQLISSTSGGTKESSGNADEFILPN